MCVRGRLVLVKGGVKRKKRGIGKLADVRNQSRTVAINVGLLLIFVFVFYTICIMVRHKEVFFLFEVSSQRYNEMEILVNWSSFYVEYKAPFISSWFL